MHVDRRIAALAAQQRGLVTRSQLVALGLGRGAIALRVRNGRLHRVHRGVYAVGTPPLATLAPETGAVLACGPDAVLSHATAAAAWGIGRAIQGPVQLTVIGEHRRRHPGIVVHVARALHDGDVVRRAGLPVTSVPRTLLDLAPILGTRDLRWTAEEARVRRLARDSDLAAVLARYPRRRGAARLRRVLGELAREPVMTRAESERRLFDLLRAAHLPLPEVNRRHAGAERDFRWPAHRLVVEVDGFASHGTRAAFESDRRRDAALTAAGQRTVRITWRRLVEEREAVIALLARLLAETPGDDGR